MGYIFGCLPFRFLSSLEDDSSLPRSLSRKFGTRCLFSSNLPSRDVPEGESHIFNVHLHAFTVSPHFLPSFGRIFINFLFFLDFSWIFILRVRRLYGRIYRRYAFILAQWFFNIITVSNHMCLFRSSYRLVAFKRDNLYREPREVRPIFKSFSFSQAFSVEG
jgi:hypothetical protein